MKKQENKEETIEKKSVPATKEVPSQEVPQTKPTQKPKQEVMKKETKTPTHAPTQKIVQKKPTSNILAFNIWDTTEIKVHDEGLKKYITLQARIVPKTGARYAGNRFHKSKVFIVERLINKLMVVGHKGKKHTYTSSHNTGRANNAYDIARKAFDIIEQKTKKNPIAVFVQALENSAPREEIINIEYGGARYPKPVECAPQRRVDVALRMMTQAAYHKSFNKKKSAPQALAEEILAAANLSNQSVAIQKKIDLERTADSSR